jgi:hypothetical protein
VTGWVKTGAEFPFAAANFFHFQLMLRILQGAPEILI